MQTKSFKINEINRFGISWIDLDIECISVPSMLNNLQYKHFYRT